jgi:hypothetical protein
MHTHQDQGVVVTEDTCGAGVQLGGSVVAYEGVQRRKHNRMMGVDMRKEERREKRRTHAAFAATSE